MSSKKTMGLMLAILGVLLVIVALAILLDVMGTKEWIAYTLIGIAAVIVIAGLLSAFYMDKPKNAKPKSAAVAKTRAEIVAGIGEGQLADAIRYGTAKIDAKVAKGVMKESVAGMFFGKLMAYAPKIGTPEEEAALVPVSQIIGGINDYPEIAVPATPEPEAPKVKEPKKKKEKPVKAAPVKAAATVAATTWAGKAAAANLGNGKLADAIVYGAGKIDGKVASGAMDDATAGLYYNRLMAYAPKIGTPEEEATLVPVSQLIGGINDVSARPKKAAPVPAPEVSKEAPKAEPVKAAPAPAKGVWADKTRAAKLGDGKLACAILYASAKIDTKFDTGKINEATANAYYNKVIGYASKIGTDAEEASMVSVSQLIGGINSL